MKVIKRDGRKKDFEFGRIESVIDRAFADVYPNDEKEEQRQKVKEEIKQFFSPLLEQKEEIDIESIQDEVIDAIKKQDEKVSKSFEEYRKKRTKERNHPIDNVILNLLQNKDEFLSKENANKRPELASTQRDLMAGTISRHLARKIIPKEIMEAHERGEIKIHDLDYFVNPITNCDLIPLDDMYKNTTVINDKLIETPKSLQTAMTLATQIVVQVTSNTYGGCTISLSHLAPYVRISFNKYKKLVKEEGKDTGVDYTKEQIEKIALMRVQKEIKDAVQTLNYQINTMSGQNGQTAFLTVFIYLNENNGEYAKETSMLAKELLLQKIKGMKNRVGIKTTQTFPKVLFVLDENNIYPDSEYYWLLKLSMKCTAIRQSPDYESAYMMKKIYGDVFPCMGCRSFLFPFKPDGKHYKWYGRLNLGVQTINLVDIALSSNKDEKEFWNIFNDRMENLIKPMGIIRYTKLKGIKAKVAPLLWEDGVFARLQPEDYITDAIDKLGCSVSIGYTGLYETVKYMTGKSNTDKDGMKFGLKIMKALEDKANDWKKETGLGFSVYGTPQEESTDWFTKKLKEKFGEIKDITDKGYITNSYHVNPYEQIDAFSKLEIEGKYQIYSKGGNVSYIETLGLENNIDAMYEVLKTMYKNNIHAEINSQSDCTCFKCGYKGKFKIDKKTLEWVCPNCGNKDQEEMSIVLRVCGYLSDKGKFVYGRMMDIISRVTHI